MRRFFRTAAVFAALGLMSAAAQSAPRVIPSNDNFANAKNLKINKPLVISGVEMASWEANEPEATCDNGDSHSLWFRVDVPIEGQIDIYTYGTQITYMGDHQPRVDQRVTITTYYDDTDDIGSLNEVACQERSIDLYTPTNLRGLGVSQGTVLIRIALDSADQILAPSQVRIQVQLYASALIKNSGFFEGLDGWKLTGGSNDGPVNGDAEINGGFPAFKFTGNPGQNATLKQTVKLGGVSFGTAATLDTAVIYAHDIADFEFVMLIKVTYKNGTTQKFKYKETADFPDLDPDGGWIAWYPLKSAKISTVQVSIPFTETSGTLVITSVELGVNGIAPSR